MIVRLLLLMALLVGSASSSSAKSPRDCFDNPTRDCVFELAFSVAEARENPGSWFSGMSHLAFLQESVGSAQSVETLDYFFGNMPRRNASAVWQTGMLQIAINFSLRKWMSDAPIASATAAEYLLYLEPSLEGYTKIRALNSAAIYLVTAGEFERAQRLLRTTEGKQKIAVQNGIARGYIHLGNVEEFYRFIDSIENPASREIVKASSLDHLQFIGELQQAELLTLDLVNDKHRMWRSASIAVSYAERGDFAEALRMVQFLTDSDGNWDRGVAQSVAKVYALAGQEEELKLLLWSIASKGPVTVAHLDEIAATLAASTGDLAQVFAYLETKDNYVSFSVGLRKMISAYLNSGQSDLEPFLDWLPAEYLSEGLRILGKVQAERGDLVGAKALFERQAELFPEESLEPHSRRALENLLLERGMVSEAVQLAFEMQDSVGLSILATQIQ